MDLELRHHYPLRRDDTRMALHCFKQSLPCTSTGDSVPKRGMSGREIFSFMDLELQHHLSLQRDIAYQQRRCTAAKAGLELGDSTRALSDEPPPCSTTSILPKLLVWIMGRTTGIYSTGRSDEEMVNLQISQLPAWTS